MKVCMCGKTKDNVVVLGCWTKLDVPPQRVLQAAMDANLKGVVVLGYYPHEHDETKTGEEFIAVSLANGPDVLWLLEYCKQKLMSFDYGPPQEYFAKPRAESEAPKILSLETARLNHGRKEESGAEEG